MNIKIPSISNVGYPSVDIEGIKKSIDTIMSNYGAYIKVGAIQNKLPKELISSFIFIESEGDERAKSNADARGLMQLTESTANDIIRREVKTGKLTKGEVYILEKYIGKAKSDKLRNSKMGDKTIYITADDLYKPELNIMLGCAYLGQVIDRSVDGKDVRIDKAVILYNRGFYTPLSALEGTYSQVMSKQPKETQMYIAKLLGKQGVLDIIV